MGESTPPDRSAAINGDETRAAQAAPRSLTFSGRVSGALQRVKGAGAQVTEAEKGEGICSCEAALERLSRLLADAVVRLAEPIDTRQHQEDNFIGARSERVLGCGRGCSIKEVPMDPPDSEKGRQGLGNSSAVLGSCTTGHATLKACCAVCALDGDRGFQAENGFWRCRLFKLFQRRLY
jgi:hypothetical protein